MRFRKRQSEDGQATVKATGITRVDGVLYRPTRRGVWKKVGALVCIIHFSWSSSATCPASPVVRPITLGRRLRCFLCSQLLTVRYRGYRTSVARMVINHPLSRRHRRIVLTLKVCHPRDSNRLRRRKTLPVSVAYSWLGRQGSFPLSAVYVPYHRIVAPDPYLTQLLVLLDRWSLHNRLLSVSVLNQWINLPSRHQWPSPDALQCQRTS